MHLDAKGRQTKRCAGKMRGSCVSPRKLRRAVNQKFAMTAKNYWLSTVSHVNLAFGHFALLSKPRNGKFGSFQSFYSALGRGS